mmetsp:Transcript_11002/g.24987  ORF Transcript_11002/g.24987 Transcript_11002/m.24987 type:complete len:122 (+) Transcript_11002:259-624(+)
MIGPMSLPLHIIQSWVLGPLRLGSTRKQSGSRSTSLAEPQSQRVHNVMALQHFSQQGTLTGVALGSYQIGGSTFRSVEKLSNEDREMKAMDVCRRSAWKILFKQVHQQAPKQQHVLQSKGL